MRLLAAFQSDTDIIALGFLPNKEVLLVGTSDNTISVRSLPRLEESASFAAGLGLIGFALHPSRNLLAAYGHGNYFRDNITGASKNGALKGENLKSGVRILKWPSGELVKEYFSTREAIECAVFSPNGTRLLAAGWRSIIWLYHLESSLIEFGCTTDYSTSSISFHPDGARLLFIPCSQEGTSINFAELNDQLVADCLPPIELCYSSTRPASFSPDGKHFAFADRFVRIYSYPGCAREFCFDARGAVCHPLEHTVEPDEQENADFGVYTYEVLDGIYEPAKPFEWSNPLFSPDSKLLICDSPDGHIFFWDVTTGKHTHTLPGHTGFQRRLALSPNGRYLVSTGGDRLLRLWQLDE